MRGETQATGLLLSDTARVYAEESVSSDSVGKLGGMRQNKEGVRSVPPALKLAASGVLAPCEACMQVNSYKRRVD